MDAIQPDVKFGSGTDDAVVLQGLTRQLSWNAEMDGQDDVFSATCKWLIDKYLTLFRVVKMPTLKSVKSLCYRVLRGAPLTPRTRYRSPFPFTELFHRDYSALFIRFVSQPRSPQSSSVHVFSSVHHPRHLNHPPSSSPKPSSILVFIRPVFLDVTKKCAKNRYL